jgi:hypothetical protein
MWRTEDEEGGMLRQYVPAKLADNPSMSTDDPTYRAKLRGLGLAAAREGHGGRRLGCGRGRLLLRVEHRAPRRRAFEIPTHWLRFRSFDWGSARPFSVGWWAIASEDHLHERPRHP